MKKQERQRYIKRLLSSNEIERQEDFVSLLRAENIEVTQATISRDIKDMQLVKVPSATGGYHYSMPVQKQMDTEKSYGGRYAMPTCLTLRRISSF